MDDIKRPVRGTVPTMDIRPRGIPQPVQRSPGGVLSKPSAPVAPAAVPVSPLPAVPTQSPAKLPAQPSTTQTADLAGLTLPAKAKAPIAAIIIAVIVALGLIGLTIFAFYKTQNNAKSGDTTASQQPEKPVTTEEVDATQTAVDKQLDTTNDAQDFSSNDLSDTSLGL